MSEVATVRPEWTALLQTRRWVFVLGVGITYVITQADAAGNTSASSASFAVTVDTTAPAVPVVNAQVTSSLTPTLTGTGIAGSTIKLYRSGVLLNPSTVVTVDPQGVWTYAASFGATGIQLVAASASDALGNTSNTSSDASITIDQAAPAVPVISGSPISSNSATPTVTGTAEANATVMLYTASLLIGQTTANGSGVWSIVTSSMATGSYPLTATATDAAGNTSGNSGAASLVIDVTPPLAPTMNAITTYSLTQALSGTAEAGATVKVYDGTTLVGTAVADSSGNWSLTTSNLGSGAHSLSATATDPAGNTGVASSPAQTISATYAAILGAADGTANGQLSLTASQFAAAGLTQIDNAAKASLLNSVIDSAVVGSVDTTAELGALADTVAGIMATAAGQTASPAITAAALAALGLIGVTSANLADVLAAIAATADNGSGVSSLSALSSVVAAAVAAAATRDAALATISAYTGSNTAPTTSTYIDAQVTGVTSGNLASINSLMGVMSSSATDTSAEVQAAVDAYTAVLAAADGTRNNSAQLVASQFAAMGLSSIDTAADLALMNRVLDTATTTQVDTAAELYAIGNAVTGIMTVAAGGTTSLTAADFALLGLTGVTSANLASVLGAIAATADDGSGVDSLVELQALVDQIVASARAAALAIITGYNGTNTAPTVNDYLNAGITGVDANNLTAVNTVIATAVTAAKDSAVEVQVIVNAFSDLLAGADGNAANNNVSLTASQYALLGVTAIDSSVKAGLMNDVVDGSARTAVDTQAELVTIASVIDRLFILAAGGTPVPPLTAADFALLGVTGVTADNLPAILAAIAATADDGSGISSLSSLQSVVTTAASASAAALGVISNYTGSNTAPTVANYASAGVTGVEAGNLAAINSVIGPLTVGETDTRAEVQVIVDAYNVLLAAADGVAGTGGTLTAAQFQALGITSINTTSEALLMSLVADTLTVAQIDTKAELVSLASIVDRLMTLAAGGTPAPPLTAADFAALGIPGVNASNLAGVLDSIAATADNGSGIDTFAKLSSVVSTSVAAQQAQSLAVISGYTGANTVPTVDNFALILVTGVTSGNLATINSALAPLSSAATDSTAEVQTVVDAYLAVLVAADGSLDNDPAVTQVQFTALGLTTIDNAAKVSLLNQVLDSRPASAVDTYSELANLASIVARIIEAAAGITPVPALTPADFAAIGVTGVTAYNIDQIVAAIAATANSGTDVDTVNGLSGVVDAAIAQAKADAIATIAAYDGTTTAPTIGDYANAAVTGVTFANLAAINSVVAVRLPIATDSTVEIQAIVDTYAAILTAADGNASATSLNLTATDYSTIGLGALDAPAEVALMNSVLSGRTNAQVATYDQLAEIARVVEALALIAAGGEPAQALTAADLALIGITGIDSTNLAPFLAAVAASGSDGSGINSLTKLQSISDQVNAAQDAALALISGYTGIPTIPTVSTYADAGALGVTAANLDAVNSVVAVLGNSVTDSTSEIQAVVNAYISVLDSADGSVGSTPLAFTAADYALLALPGVNTVSEVALMNEVISGRTAADVDTFTELADLARIVEALMLTAAGGIPTPTLTAADLALIGITGVDASNLVPFLDAIAASGANGGGIDSLAKIQTISDQVNVAQDAAIALIAAYDGTNTAPSLADLRAAGIIGIGASGLTGFNETLAVVASSGSDTYAEVKAIADAFTVIRDYDGTNTAPSVADFALLGVVGVGSSDLAGVNSFLATMAPGLTDSLTEIQALVDAFSVLHPGADGIDNDNVDLTAAQWQALGFVDAVTPEDIQALDDLFDTIDWTVAVDAGTATTSGQAALAALRAVVAPRSGGDPAVAPTATPTPSPTSTATATPQPTVSATPAPTATRKPAPQPSPSETPVYAAAPKPGAGIVEVAPGEVAAVVDGNEQNAIIEVINDYQVRVTVPNRVIVNLSSILTDGKPAKVASDGALLVVQGTSVDISGSGYMPNSLVDLWIYSTPTHLGTVTADAQGDFSANFPIPVSIPAGDHTVKIDGKDFKGELTTVSVGVRVLPKSQEASVDSVNPSPTATNSAGLSDGSSLVSTTTAVVLGAFLLLLLLGFFFVAVRRRRAESH